MSWSAADHQYMARAIQLGRQGLYTTHPNPRVGCVIVCHDQIVGEGLHWRAGEGHAEVNALAMAGDQAQGATAYVTLEPCSHYGRTPPCADALINAGVSKVIAAMVDPNPQVSGRGMQKLQQAGIETSSGLLESEAQALNCGFIKRMQTGLPWVRVKLATSLDGRTAMASGESQWITGAAARSDVQKLRARSSAIVTGVDSILQDDSALTVRAAQLNLPNAARIAEQQPLRIVLDSKLRTPLNANILQQPGKTIIVTCVNAKTDYSERYAALVAAGVEVKCMPEQEGRVCLSALLAWLGDEMQCNELLVETGATLAGAFMQSGLVDEVYQYIAPTLLGSSARAAFELPLTQMSEQLRLNVVDQRWLGDDLRLILQPLNSQL